MPGDKETIEQFAARIKAKYPQYKDVDNATLTQKMIAKYPEYKERVDMGGSAGATTSTPAPSWQPPNFLLPKQAVQPQSTTSSQVPSGWEQQATDKTITFPDSEQRTKRTQEASQRIAEEFKAIDPAVKSVIHSEKSKQYLEEVESQFSNKGVDATANKQMLQGLQTFIPKITGVESTEIEEYKAAMNEDQSLARKALSEHAKLNPAKSYKIQSDMYKVDRANSYSPRVNENADKILSGDLHYDINTGQLEKRVGFIGGVAHSYNERQKQIEDFKFLTSDIPEAEKIDFLEEKIKPQNPDEPAVKTEGAKGWLGETVGGQPPEALMAGAATAMIPGGQGAAPWVAAAVASPDAGMRGYANSLIGHYADLRHHDIAPDMALKEAQRLAKTDAALDVAQNFLMTAVGVKAGLKSTKIDGSFMKTVLSATKGLAKESGGIGGLGAIVQGIKNYTADKDVLQETGDAFVQNGATVLALAALIKAPSIVRKSPLIVKKLLSGLAKNPEAVKSNLAEMVTSGDVTPEQANKVTEDITAHTEQESKIPSDVTDEDVRGKLQRRFEKYDNLKSQLETQHESTHPAIKEKIKALEEEIGTLSQPTPKEKTEPVAPTKEEKIQQAKDLIYDRVDDGHLSDVYKHMMDTKPEETLNFIADQAYGRTQDGSFHPAEGVEDTLVKDFGKDVVDLAKEIFPLEENAPNEKPRHGASWAGIANVKLKESESQASEKPVEQAPIPEPSTEVAPIEVKPGGAETVGITHAAMDEISKEFGLDTYEKNPEKIKEWDEQAAARIQKPGELQSLFDKLRKSETPDPVETRMMLQYMADLKAKLNVNPTSNELLTQLKRTKDLFNVAGRIQGKALRARQGERPVEETLPDLLVRKLDANQAEILTPEQKSKVIQQYEELKSAKQGYKDIVDKREQGAAEETVQQMKAATPKLKKEHTEYVKDRERIFASIKDKLKKSRGELNAVPVPYVKELIAISPDVAKLVKSFVEEGVDKLSDLVSNIHPLVKDAIPEATEKDVLDIISGKYTPEKKAKSLSKDELAAKDRLIKIKQEIEISLLKDQYANRTKGEKVKDAAIEVLNVPRTIMSSTDFSAPLRQGLIPTISHPGTAIKAFGEMFKQAVSQKRFDRWFFDLRESPEFKTMEESGLYVADPHDPKLSAKEEAFMNNLAEKIPIAGKFIKGSERAYVSYLNKMRVDLFKQGQEVLEASGKTIENSKKDYEGLASWINNSTGRGGLGEKGEMMAPVLNTAFFSPRLIAARLNALNPFFYAKLPKEIRVMALKDMAKFVGFGMSVLGLAKLSGAEVEADPRSSDFGKIKVGNTRYDIWGGFQQYVRLIAQVFTGKAKSTRTGAIRELNGKGAFGESRGDVLGRFVRGKLAPIPGTALDFLTGRTIVGEEVSVPMELEKNLLPLIYSDVKDAIKDQGVKAIFTTGLPATFGVGVQTYDQKPPSSKKSSAHKTKNTKKANKKK